MKFAALFALLATAEASKVNLSTLEKTDRALCTPALEISQKQLDIELDYFSRNFDTWHYDNALHIYGELKGAGKKPRVSVHTWELYDNAFTFPRVRRYQLVQDHMEALQHFEDNFNANFTNQQALNNFLDVAHAA